MTGSFHRLVLIMVFIIACGKIFYIIPQIGFAFSYENSSSATKEYSQQDTVNSDAVGVSVIDREGRFIKYASGVVKDTQTGLEWFAGPDDSTHWTKAKKWVKRLRVAGGGWRMPTLAELETLYQQGAGTRNLTPLLRMTGFWIWSGEVKDPAWAWGFAIYYGIKDWLPRDYHIYGRAFAVRFAR